MKKLGTRGNGFQDRGKGGDFMAAEGGRKNHHCPRLLQVWGWFRMKNITSWKHFQRRKEISISGSQKEQNIIHPAHMASGCSDRDLVEAPWQNVIDCVPLPHLAPMVTRQPWSVVGTIIPLLHAASLRPYEHRNELSPLRTNVFENPHCARRCCAVSS